MFWKRWCSWFKSPKPTPQIKPKISISASSKPYQLRSDLGEFVLLTTTALGNKCRYTVMHVESKRRFNIDAGCFDLLFKPTVAKPQLRLIQFGEPHVE